MVQVEAVKHLRTQDLAFYEFIITGHTRGYAEAVGLTVERECAECGLRRYAYPKDNPLVLPERCWDGSDVFMIEDIGVPAVTEAFRECVQQDGHTGIEFTPLGEWRRWYMPQSESGDW